MEGEKKEVETILMSVKEACEYVGVGRNTMLKLTRVKGFPAIRFKRKIYIEKKGLEIWFSKKYGELKL